MNCDEKGKIALDPREVQRFSPSSATAVELNSHKEGFLSEILEVANRSCKSQGLFFEGGGLLWIL
jgi:hypothetical protein